jgi:hypothetical protein
MIGVGKANTMTMSPHSNDRNHDTNPMGGLWLVARQA